MGFEAPIKTQVTAAIWTTQIAAGTDDTLYWVCKLDGNYLVESATYVPNSTSATNGTDYQILTVTNDTQSRTIASKDTSAASWTAGTPVALTLGTGKTLEIASGEVVKVAMTHAGAGKGWRGKIILVLRQF